MALVAAPQPCSCVLESTPDAPAHQPQHLLPPALSDAQFERKLLAAQPGLKRFAKRLAGAQEWEDLLQDALLILWKNRHKYVKDDNFEAWAHLVLRRQHLNMVARPNPRHRLVLVGNLTDLSTRANEGSGSYDVGRDARSLEKDYHDTCTPQTLLEAQQVRDAMDQQLLPKVALVIKLKVKGYNYADIGAMLNITYNAARARCFQGRKILRRQFRSDADR